MDLIPLDYVCVITRTVNVVNQIRVFEEAPMTTYAFDNVRMRMCNTVARRSRTLCRSSNQRKPQMEKWSRKLPSSQYFKHTS
jgi:hypothetical protein